MNEQETRSILTVALMAAFADGMKDDTEREAVKRVAESLGSDAGIDLTGLYRDVLLSKPDLAVVAGTLQSPGARQLAYEMAVGVCEADGSRGPAESEFLARLAAALGLATAAAAEVQKGADELSGQPLPPAPAALSRERCRQGPCPTPRWTSPERIDHQCGARAARDACLDGDHPVADAARASHRPFVRHEMDMSNAKDFVATLGVGLTGQYLEQFGRKLFGGLLGGLGGSLGRGVGRQAASSGDLRDDLCDRPRRQRYYAAGRTIDAATLKQTFLSMVNEAKGSRRATRARSSRCRRDRHAQPRVADQVGLTAPDAQECVIACARSAPRGAALR
jgi:tellurite resistance protein